MLDDGRLLVAGGMTCQGSPPTSCKMSGSASIFDPRTGISSPTGSLLVPEAFGSAVRLDDGRIAIVSGEGPSCDATGCAVLDEIQIYDSATGQWTDGGRLPMPWSPASAVRLPGDRILILGGVSKLIFGQSIEQVSTVVSFDPATGRVSSTGSLPSGILVGGTLLLADGRVLVLPSDPASGAGRVAEHPQIYDPKTTQFSSTEPFFSTGTSDYAATLLESGKVLIAGGSQCSPAYYETNKAELLDPATGHVASTGVMWDGSYGRVAVRLLDGRVLVAGGDRRASAEIYDPRTGKFSRTGDMAVIRYHAMAFLLPSGQALIVGGAGQAGVDVSPIVEAYQP